VGEVISVNHENKLVTVQCFKIESDYSVTATCEDVVPLASVVLLPGVLRRPIMGKEVDKKFLQRVTTKALGPSGGYALLKNLNDRLLHVDPAVDPQSFSGVSKDFDTKQIQVHNHNEQVNKINEVSDENRKNIRLVGLRTIEQNLLGTPYSTEGNAGQVSSGRRNSF
jgi:hypothetical protein